MVERRPLSTSAERAKTLLIELRLVSLPTGCNLGAISWTTRTYQRVVFSSGEEVGMAGRGTMHVSNDLHLFNFLPHFQQRQTIKVFTPRETWESHSQCEKSSRASRLPGRTVKSNGSMKPKPCLGERIISRDKSTYFRGKVSWCSDPGCSLVPA
jgi:hypothetical protein